MSIVMIMSQSRIDQEHGMLNRLVVGLANEGEHVVRIVPPTPFDEPALHERAVSLTKRVTTPMPVSRFLRNARVQELLIALEKVEVDAFVAFGHDALQVARDLAKKNRCSNSSRGCFDASSKACKKIIRCLEMASSNADFRTIHSKQSR